MVEGEEVKYEVWGQRGMTGPWSLHVTVSSLKLAEKIIKVMDKDGWGYEVISTEDKSLVRTNVP